MKPSLHSTLTAATPLASVLGDEIVIAQLRIRAAHAINFLALAGAEGFVGIETPQPFQQALTTQDFVKAWNATGIVVRRIEEGGVAIRDFAGAAQQFGRNWFSADRQAATLAMQFHQQFSF